MLKAANALFDAYKSNFLLAIFTNKCFNITKVLLVSITLQSNQFNTLK